MAQENEIKIAIVDDHSLFRKGMISLVNLVSDSDRYTIVFEAANGVEMVMKLKIGITTPDLILIDIDMPKMDGYESVKWLRHNFPDIKIIVLTMLDTEEAIIKMLRMGANGFLSKDIEVEDIGRAFHETINKGYYYSEPVSLALAKEVKGRSLNEGGVGEVERIMFLTEREKQFLMFACSDMTYAQIAHKMFLSPKTIDGYREALFQKFNVRSRVGLAIHAVKNNLITI